MNRPTTNRDSQENNLVRDVLGAIALLFLISLISPLFSHAGAESVYDVVSAIEYEAEDDEDWPESDFVILDDPEYFIFEEEEAEPIDWDAYYEAMAHQEYDMDESDDDLEEELIEDEIVTIMAAEPEHAWHTITSVGKTNVKIHGVKSKYKLLEYTIPDQLMRNDPKFAALMMEAEKYIGYPYVYGAANPNIGFDCSGFVSYVYIHSGVYNTGRKGANGLHNLCVDIDPEDARPGDIIFFQGTMGPDVKGITHCGIYVGNNMMIHAGDPIGFADLTEEKWVKRFHCFGRLPID